MRLDTHAPRDRGAAALEAGLLLAGIAAVLTAALALMGEELHELFTTALTALGGS